MIPNEVLISVLRWLTLAGMMFTSARLLLSGLHRRYRVFFVFLIFSSLRSGALLTVDVRSGAYMKIWILTEPVLWLLYILLVLELCSLILESHKGLYTVGRWALWGALALALVSAMLSLAPPANDPFNQSRVIAFCLLTGRGLLFSLVIFLVAILWFLSHYPVELSRNVIYHSLIYALFFLATSITFLIRSMLGYEVAKPVNALLGAISLGCVVAWATLLDRAGEKETRKLRGIWREGQEQRLIGQLDALNATLLRVARK